MAISMGNAESKKSRSVRSVDLGACDAKSMTEPVRKMSEIEQYLMQINNAIDEMGTAISSLDKHLTTVLVPEKCDECCDKSADPSCNTQLATWLREFASRIRVQTDRINSMDVRCELSRDA